MAAAPIVNYVRARTAFMPIMLVDDGAEPGGEDDVELHLTLLPEGQRVLTEAVPDDARILLAVSYRAATEELGKGWTGLPSAEDAAALLVARFYQVGGRIRSGGGAIPLTTEIVKIEEL